MKKVLKNILKWLVCVFLTFTVFFTIMQFQPIALGLCFRTEYFGNTERFEEVLGEESISNIIKYNNENIENGLLSENSNDVWSKLYSQYPAGVARTISLLLQYLIYGDLAITSLTLGLIIGTAIYMLLDKEKKGLKIAILIYIISIIILGFVEGLLYVSGDNLTILDYWIFPEEFIVPVSIAFALVIAARYIKQKDIANKLNEKLKQIKEEKNK